MAPAPRCSHLQIRNRLTQAHTTAKDELRGLLWGKWFGFFFVGTVNFIDGIQESRAPWAPPTVLGVWDGN